MSIHSDNRYSVWLNIKQRCYNPNNPKYNVYGGRGIGLCEDWRNDFSTFCEGIGRRPSLRYCIDRIDNDKGYEPGNVRWVTWDFNRRHRRPRIKEEKPFVFSKYRRIELLHALGMKWCPKCKILKTLSDFFLCSSKVYGTMVYCKPCSYQRGKPSKKSAIDKFK